MHITAGMYGLIRNVFLLLTGTFCLLAASPVTAFNRIQLTDFEWKSWSRECKAQPYTYANPPRGETVPQLSAAEKEELKGVGAWHYCIGYIKVMRAELLPASPERSQLLKEALEDVTYSYSKINHRVPMAAEMAVTYSRAIRMAGEREKALEVLGRVKKLHPQYFPIYTAYARMYFDVEDFGEAIKILEEGNAATNDKIGELQYFLGLAYLKSGDIENARIYNKKAENSGYPLKYLSRALAAHDRADQGNTAAR